MTFYDVAALLFAAFISFSVVGVLLQKMSKKATHTESAQADTDFNPGAHGNAHSIGGTTNDDMELNWYKILGVAPIATVPEIKAAYRKAMAEYHPDKVATMGIEIRDLAAKKAHDINLAYNYALNKLGEQFFR